MIAPRDGKKRTGRPATRKRWSAPMGRDEIDEYMRDVLDDRERAFVTRYVETLDTVDAAIASGYGTDRDRRAAYNVGRRIKAAPKVRRAIAGLTADCMHDAQVDIAGVLRKIAAQAFFDVSSIVRIVEELDPETETVRQVVRVMPTEDWPEIAHMAVDSVRQTRDGIEVKAGGASKALDLLAKYVKLVAEGDKERDGTHTYIVLPQQSDGEDVWQRETAAAVRRSQAGVLRLLDERSRS